MPKRARSGLVRRRRADEWEGRQIKLDGARCRTLTDHDVDLIVLECRVKNLFHDGRKPVNFIDEEHVVLFEIRQDGSEVPRALQYGARGLTQVHTHLFGDDVRERGFA